MEPRKYSVLRSCVYTLSLTYPFSIMENLLQKQSLIFWRLILEIEKVTGRQKYLPRCFVNRMWHPNTGYDLENNSQFGKTVFLILPLFNSWNHWSGVGKPGNQKGVWPVSITIWWMTRTFLEVKKPIVWKKCSYFRPRWWHRQTWLTSSHNHIKIRTNI